MDHSEKCTGVQFGAGCKFGAGDAQTFLQIFLVSNQHVDVFDDAPDHLQSSILAARNFPKLLAEIQVERDYGAGGLGHAHALDDQFSGCLGKRRENSAAVEPAHADGENCLPIEVSGF